MPRAVLSFLSVSAVLFLANCESSPPPYQYRYVPGRTAILDHGRAIAPACAPECVKRAIAAGNHIAGLPYIYGGGHRSFECRGYDCSGTASYVLHGAGLIATPEPSDIFRRYGAAGAGQWITIYARRGHVFMTVAGLRMDTGWNGEREGPRWSMMSRPAKGCVLRHPVGL
jgi:hypothetical protein